MQVPGYIVVTDHSDGDVQQWLMDLVVAEVDGATPSMCSVEATKDCRWMNDQGVERSGLEDHASGEFFCWPCVDNWVRENVWELRMATSADREKFSHPSQISN